MTTKTLKININRVYVIRTLLVAIFCTAAMYIYFIGSIAFSADMRSQISSSVIQLQSEISGLEFDLISASGSIDRSVASELGLIKSVENEAVVVVRNGKTRLTFNE
jgi:hypothetical protein